MDRVNLISRDSNSNQIQIGSDNEAENIPQNPTKKRRINEDLIQLDEDENSTHAENVEAQKEIEVRLYYTYN